MNKQIEKRWAWVLTGSGHFFTETIDLINNLEKVDLFISKAAEEVLVMYKKKGKVSKNVKIYLCSNFTCNLPIENLDELKKALT